MISANQKIALVTGGTKGIGLSIVRMLLRKNFFVYLTYANDDETALLVKKDLQSVSSAFRIEKVNQSDISEVLAFAQKIKASHSHLDCLVCNTGKTLRKKIRELALGEWEDVFCVGLTSHVYLIRDLWDLLQNHSKIIFIGSEMGIYPNSTSVAYGVMKAAVHALAKNLVKEFEGTGTTVNAIAPGFVETVWQKNKPLDIRQNIENKTALHRFAHPDEIAHAVTFCLENDFLNGSVIELNGGYDFK